MLGGLLLLIVHLRVSWATEWILVNKVDLRCLGVYRVLFEHISAAKATGCIPRDLKGLYYLGS